MSMRKLTSEEVVASYGTFGNPVVLDSTGRETVCELYFVDADGQPLYLACQSRGCDYCSSAVEGCRCRAANANLGTEWFYED